MSRAIKGFGGVVCLACLLASGMVHAQLAPTPKKAPRTPVKKEVLAGSKTALPASRVVEGPALVLDAERLKINDIEVRLFGVVPPQLSASFGPQARGIVDALAQGDVTCRIRDRDRDGRLLASCRNASDADFGIELLRRGLAVTARGSLRPTELARPYIAAEEAAKAQRLGIWSVSLPKAASENEIREAVRKAEEIRKEKAKEAEAAKVEEVKTAPPKAEEGAKQAVLENKAAESSPQAETPSSTVSLAQATAVSSGEDKGKISLSPTAEEIQAILKPSPIPEPEEKGFLEKYQLMIVGLLALATAFVWAAASALFRSKEKRDELRAIAAALRGEMMAARSICLARLSKMANDKDEKAASWPRIRSLVFQAYVGQLGRLGAELSRQIASVYGQASDYASYYVGAESKPDVASKRQSLQTLVQHIEEVVPRLAEIEQKGAISRPRENQSLGPSLLARVVKPASLAAPTTKDDGGPGRPAPLPAPEEVAEKDEKTKTPEREENNASEPEKGEAKPEEKKEEKPSVKVEEMPKTKSSPSNQQQRTAAQFRAAARKAQRKKKIVPKAQPQTEPFEKALAFLLDTIQKIDIKTSWDARWAKIKDATFAGWQRLHPQPYEDVIPDYANLTDEELEALAYDEDAYYMSSETERRRRVG